MREKLVSILCVVVFFMMAFSLSGCGEKSKFIGTWEAELNMLETLNKELPEEISEYLNFKDVALPCIFTFYEDGTFKIEGDEDKFSDLYGSIAEEYEKGIKGYLEDLAKEEGFGRNVDEVLELNGVTMEELMDEVLDGDLLKEFLFEFEAEGNWKAANGKLYTTDDKSAKFSKDAYDTYEFISGSELRLIEPFGENSEESKEMYPITLKKR